MPAILLHWDADGQFSFMGTEGVNVVCVDERCPNDRVYLSQGAGDRRVIDAVASGAYRDPVDAANAILGRPQ